jgi:tetrahydromethanopterin S-methyltransferase subunit F
MLGRNHMSLISSTPVIETLASEWVRHFRRSPFVTVLATLTFVAIVVVGIKEFDAYEKQKREATRLASSSYSQQVIQIRQLENNVTELLSFLDSQKKMLEDTQDTILRLENERKKLKPLVESDKQVVEAIFRAQEDRIASGALRERIIGFALGVLSSLVASFIWLVSVKLISMRRSKPELSDVSN